MYMPSANCEHQHSGNSGHTEARYAATMRV